MNTASDILIIGGGVIGLAIAIELKLRGANVTVLSRDFAEAATHAAAGMLAPQAEAIAEPALLELGLKSRMLYPNWVQKIEEISGLSTGYWTCGILAPSYERPKPGNLEICSSSSPALWLDQTAVHHAQPGLSSEVIGGFWFPEDAQVNNRALAQALKAAAQTLGVDLREGVTVEAVQQQHGQVISLRTTAGEWQAEQYVLATGAWSSALLPVPVQPRKGQMLSVRIPSDQANLPLQRVLFGAEVYIVPRQDGRIVIGATSESVGFTPGNTAAGLQKLLAAAIRLYPVLQEFPIEECWWGFRPTTPDEAPILGAGLCQNLTLAVGHHRNGILLAPVTALLIADFLSQQQSTPLLQSFSWERFHTSTEAIASPSIKPVSNSAQPSADSNGRLNSNSIDSNTVHSNAMLKQYSTPLDRPEIDTTEPVSNSLDQPLVIAGRSFRSRLMTGTGKYRNFEEMRQSIAASGCEIITVAVRRVQTNAPGHEGLAEALDWKKLWMLPNTAGCKTAEEAIRVARLGREMAKLLGQEDNNFVKLEVIPDAKYLLPDPIGTLEAAEQLVKEGFAVLPYINADPLLAQRLEAVGCATVMPLGSPIGSGQGIKNEANIQIIIENANIPVVVDAGIGAPSEAAQAMEMGADALLINTAIAQAQNPALMGRAMGMAAEAGRLAYLAGRIPVKTYASASSPLTGTIAP
ncbi:glycine oxidase ThiO [Leptolyngbya sp. FACHB-671]|uniref:glycine oxidase ThiO n=1 Tax=Leptolyngbya sp. FACHB-671 TaxID=2692812 RepID=UPI00168971B5|nr:glycine oxidase ThiO [Leptolyngbya sp. FACHB-671]